jgi:transketolase
MSDLTQADLLQLKLKSIQYRRTILEIIHRAGAGHTSGDLSCIDVLNVLYNRVLNVSPATFASPDRDRYIHSKGHCVEALYAVLADRGFFPAQDLQTLGRFGSRYIGHPTRGVPGIEQNTGALGHGLPLAVGMALAGKMNHRRTRVFVLLGDGELAEGSNWEASMAAAHYRLDNLVAIVDRNYMQITGQTEQVCGLEPLAAKFEAFGYAVREVDGHDVAVLADVLGQAPFVPGRPSLVLARTIKGKGVTFMENIAKWHHGVPTDQEYAQAMAELEAARKQLLEGADGDAKREDRS